MDEPFAIGPWRVLGRLGAGGMGVVFRARHRDTGAVAAVKTLRAADPLVARALRREIRALARLSHPGVVPILDDGQQDGVPWYAMGLVEGPTLADVRLAAPQGDRPSATTLDRAEAATRADLGADDATRPEPWASPGAEAETSWGQASGTVRVGSDEGPSSDPARVALVYARLAAALAWVHGEGVVHQDLKPANVVLRDGDFPVLVDFGLAGAFAAAEGREALEISGFAGTVAYMSPEQIRGDAVDARADLYALGVMLFRALTGRAPFVGEAAAVIDAHLHRAPPSIAALVGGVPEALDELVQALLAKDPRDRIGHAGVVADRLAEWAGPDAIPEGWPAPRPYLYRPALAGRDAATRWLEDQVGRGGVALVEGASGMGKTRLLVETGRQAAARGHLVLTGRAVGPHEPGAGPLHPLRGPLEQLAERHRDDPERVFGDRGGVVAPYAAGVPEGAPVAELPPALARERLVDAVADTLRAAARCEPVLVLLDDLHDADALTLEVLHRLAREERGEPLVVVATWRSGLVGGALAPLPEAARVRLAPLDASSLTGLVGDMLAEGRVAERLLAFLHAHADGNPLFVAEYLRAAVDRGMLARDARGRWAFQEAARTDDLGLPSTIDGLLAQRLAMLDPDLLALAELAAVLGREVDAGVLLRASPSAEEVVLDALRALTDRQVLVETAGGARFAHPALQERLYAGIPGPRRMDLHRAALAALPEEPATLAARAHHAEHAGAAEQAATLWLEAGRDAIGRYDPAAAESALRSCLRLAGPALAMLARFYLGYEVLMPQGRLDEATAVTEQELADARAHGELNVETRAMRSLGAYAIERGHLEQARAIFSEALELDRARGWARGRVYGATNLAEALRGLGRPEEAMPLFLAAVEDARQSDMPWVLPSIIGQSAACRHALGELDAAESAYTEAIASARSMDDRTSEAMFVGNLANLLVAMDRVEEAEAHYRAAIAMQRALGYELGEALPLQNHGLLQLALGDVAGAEASCRRSMALYLRRGRPDGVYEAGLVLLDLLHDAGRHEEATALLEGFPSPEAAPWIPFAVAVARARGARLQGQREPFAAHVAQAEALRGARKAERFDLAFEIERGHLAAASGEPAGLDAWPAPVEELPPAHRAYYLRRA